MEQHANKNCAYSVLVMFVVFLFNSQSVYSIQLCVHTEQWIHNFGLTPVLAQRLAVWSVPN